MELKHEWQRARNWRERQRLETEEKEMASFDNDMVKVASVANRETQAMAKAYDASMDTKIVGGEIWEAVGEDDPINPSHYTNGIYEPVKVIRDWKLSFEMGSCLKYINRAGKKGDLVEDLRKAIRYIELEIERVTL